MSNYDNIAYGPRALAVELKVLLMDEPTSVTGTLMNCQ
mgnify:CR=1 FL=1